MSGTSHVHQVLNVTSNSNGFAVVVVNPNAYNTNSNYGLTSMVYAGAGS